MSKKKKLVITKVLDVSTAHITEKDNNLLSSNDTYVISYPKDHGFFVYVPEAAKIIKTFARDGYSKAFLKLMKMASEHKCGWIMLDSDGTVYPQLKVFDW